MNVNNRAKLHLGLCGTSILRKIIIITKIIKKCHLFPFVVFKVCSDSVDEHGSTLRSLARDIESDEQMYALGRKLGFSESVLDRFAASNRIEGKITCKGNTDMLFEWRQEVVPSELPFRLKKTLRQAGLVFLAEKHFPYTLQPEGKYLINVNDDGLNMST